MSKKTFTSYLMAAAITVNCLTAMPFCASAVDTVKYEAEEAVLNGVAEIATEISDYSGEGYVNLTDNTPSVTFTVNVDTAGTYGLVVGYATAYGSKPMQITVNGSILDSLTLDETETFQETNNIKVSLNAGENTIEVTASWGWMQLDYITIGEYEAQSRPAITATQTAPCDTDAIDEVKALMSYLSSVYGEHILSGQQEIYMYGPHDIEQEFEYIYEKTGKYPAIRGFDYGNFCCPAFGSDDGSTDRIIAWAEKGGICTASFHLNVPTDFASYTIGSNIDFSATTYGTDSDFSPKNAATEGTKENEYYTQALDTLAEQFLILQEKGIPIIWRPLHEAEGNGGESGSWFWWGTEGSAVYRELWIYTYDYLTNVKGCHNLIWEWNSYDYSTSANWYPGDEYVDIIGYDKYNCTDWSTGIATYYHNDSAIADTFYSIMERYNYAKMVAMAECDCFSTVENLTTEKAGWLYFLPWYDGGTDESNFLSNPIFNTEEDLIAMYQSEYCITLDELPNLYEIEYDPTATNGIVNTEPTTAEEGHATISSDGTTIVIDLPEAAGTIYLVVELADGVTYANGGLGAGTTIDGVYYWGNIQWETTGSGEVEVNLADNLYNITDPDGNEVTDETIIAAFKEALAEMKSFQFQVWWAGEDVDVSEAVTLTDAYVKAVGTQDPTETTSEEETTEPTGASETETQDTTGSTSTKKGDVNSDGNVNIMDVIMLNKVMLNKETLTEQQEKNADIDGDGIPSAEDSLSIMKYIVGLITL